MTSKYNQLWKKVSKMDLGNPIITTLVGLVIFYIGLKTFSGGMKSMGNMEHLHWFTGSIHEHRDALVQCPNIPL